MNNETLELLEGKIKKAVELIDKLNNENKIFSDENSRLKKDMVEFTEKISNIESKQLEISDSVKVKLGNIMNRLVTLEQN